MLAILMNIGICSEMGDVFSSIYSRNVWGVGSGHGSLKENTREYRKILSSFFNNSDITTFVDLGCGDWQFMKYVQIPSDKVYLGVDVVKDLIVHHNQEYSKDNVKFRHILIMIRSHQPICS